MPRPTDACPGPCNGRLLRDWDTHETAVQTHLPAILAAIDGLTDLDAIRKAAYTAPDVPEPPEPRTYWRGDPIWCAWCTALVRRALAELDMLCALIEAANDGHRDAGRENTAPTGTRGKSASEPSASPVVDQLDRMLGYLLAVQDAYRTVRNWPPRPTGGRQNRGAQARIEAIAWLGVHLDDILRHPGSVRFGRGVLAWERILRDAAKAGPVDERMQGRCPMTGCGRVALRRWRDPEHVKCGHCGAIMRLEDYEAMRERQLQQVEQRRAARAS